MTETSQNVVLWSGDDLIMRFTVKDKSGNPVDLAGASAKWFLAKTPNSRLDANILIKKDSSDDQQIWFDHPDTFWRINVRLTPADTENIAPNANYYHECQAVLFSGEVTTPAIGKFKLNPTVIPDPS